MKKFWLFLSNPEVRAVVIDVLEALELWLKEEISADQALTAIMVKLAMLIKPEILPQ